MIATKSWDLQEVKMVGERKIVESCVESCLESWLEVLARVLARVLAEFWLGI